ncbi:MAG: DUF5618 family protein [Nitrospinae bacterium]|nr:DUF5618 family protein [Nitrospinota bacterium]
MSEAIRYLKNAKDILGKVPIEDNIYTDIKPVRESCGTAYLAILKGIDEYLIKRGVDEKDLPQSVDGYRNMLQRYLIIHNGKLLKGFEALYKELHIAGYYRGNLYSVDMIKAAMRDAKTFIDKIKVT